MRLKTCWQAKKALWIPSLWWLVFLAPFFFLTYGQVNLYTASLSGVNSLVFDWESAIPFWPWTIVPYWSIDILYGISLFVCTSKRELMIHVMRLISASLIACLGFLLFPLRFSFTRPVSEGLFGWLFTQLEQFDLPFNQAPSLHIILLWLLWIRFYPHTPKNWRWLLHSWFALIGVSVLTTWQHHFIDVVTGFAVGVLISYLLPISSRWHWHSTVENRRRKLALRYSLGAVLLTAIAYGIGDWGWLWLWPAFALLMVALGYWGFGSTIFQKNRDGKMSPSARLLLLPYQMGAWLSFLYFQRKSPEISQITPTLYLGSFPQKTHSIDAVLDLTAEWPKSRFIKNQTYIACPRLDLVAPTVNELSESVEALNQLVKNGTVLIHCALGLSRSAIVLIAYLLQHGDAKDIEDAVKLVKKVRPNIVIHQGHYAVLTQWWQQISQELHHA